MYLRKLYRILIIIGIEFLYELSFINGYWVFNLSAFFFFFFGTVVGDLILEARDNNSWNSFLKKMGLSGIILFTIGVINELYLINTYDLTIPHTTTKYAPFFNNYSLGMFVLVFAILFWIQDYNKEKPRKFEPIRVFSSLSLTIFYFHLIIGTSLFIPSGLGNTMSLYSYVIFIFCFYFSIYVFFGVLWGRKKYIYSFEWIIRRFS